MATVHEGNKLFDAQSVKGNIDNNNNVIRNTVNTGSQPSGNNILRSGVEGDDIVLNNTTIEQNGLLGNDNETYRIVVIGSQDIRYPISDSGYIEDGTGENPLRPVVYDGDILYIYTIRGAVTSLVINTDNTYNKEVYPILYKLDESSILPHVSVTDLNVASGYRMVAINAVRNDDSISLWYYQTNGINGNCDIYKVTIYPDGTCEREHGNIDDGFYRVGEDGYFWKWDNDLKQYVSTGKHTSILYARELLDADDLFFKDSNDQGEEITIEDPGTTGTVLWGAESANKVSLSVNGVSKLLLKSQALDGINSSISTILGYFSSGSARNALLLEGHNSDYFATGAGLDAIDIRVTALENTSFDPTEMWDLLSAATSEQINISHIPDITTSKILNLESWITGKGYITNSADNLINYYLKNDVYNKQEVAELIGSISQFHFEIYPELPAMGQSNVLYLIGPKGDTDVYDEYVYSNNAWTRIGSTSIDLSGYVQNTRTINTGSGLVGGGDLSANRTISLSQGTIASLALADTALQQSSLDGYVNDIVIGQGNYISGVSKNGKVLTFTYGTLPTTIALSNVTGAEDLQAIEALSGTGFLKRTGDNLWALDDNTYALSGDLLAVSGRVTTLESRINWDNYFGIDAQGNIYVRGIDENTPRAFYNNGSITAGGINSSGGGGGNIDLDRVWESLTNNTDKPNVEINPAHIPDITVSKVSNIESWILGKGYITSSAIPTNVSDFNNDAGYLTDYTIYALTIKNSAGTDVLTYNPKTAAGELSLTKAMIGLGNVENTALSTWVGSQNIATLGTITTGVWHGTKIANEYLALDMSWSLVRASATYDTEDYVHAN